MRTRDRLTITPVIIACVITGCTVGPTYEPPTLPEVDRFRFATDDVVDTADVEWWTMFGDPVLNDLIDEALQNNYDVRIAASRVDEFAARIGITRSTAFPQVGYGAGASRSQSSNETPQGQLSRDRVSDLFDANLNVDWELDVFGRVRRATEAAKADTLAQEEIRRGVILSLVTSVATSYVALRSLDEQLDISLGKLATRQSTLNLFELQFENGVISQLELAQIRTEYERTAAAIPAIEREIALLENSLSVLLGRPPGTIRRGRTIQTLAAPPVPSGLPSDLLRRRPDLREAEQRLFAANERVGQAVANFYPTFSLTAALGVASDDLTDLFSSSALTYSVAAGVAGPLFTAGLLENQLGAAEAIEQQAIDIYRRTVLTALRESEDALVTRTTTIAESDARQRQVESLRLYAELAQMRYDNGYVDYLEVLDAERDLFDAELESVRLRSALYASLINIYKAFGGGWVQHAEEAAERLANEDVELSTETVQTD